MNDRGIAEDSQYLYRRDDSPQLWYVARKVGDGYIRWYGDWKSADHRNIMAENPIPVPAGHGADSFSYYECKCGRTYASERTLIQHLRKVAQSAGRTTT